MATKIEWTQQPGTKGETWNPCVGCSEVSQGCRNCYAAKVAHRGMSESHKGLTVLKPNGVHWNGTVRPLPERLTIPLGWKKPRTVFVCSMSDLFHEDLSDEYIAAVFGVMAACPQHTFIVLTKRAQRMRDWFGEQDDLGPFMEWAGLADEAIGAAMTPTLAQRLYGHFDYEMGETDREWPLPNVRLGVSAEDQQRADERIPLLLECPAAVRWVSAEPLLGPLDMSPFLPGEYVPGDAASITWVVVGGESGSGARPHDGDWPRSIIAQCQAAGVAVFHKQMGAHVIWSGVSGPGEHWRDDLVAGAIDTGLGHWRMKLANRKGADMDEWPEDLRVREFPGAR